MNTIIEHLTELFTKAAKKAFPELESPPIELTQSTQEKFGHYQCNSAMKMAKPLSKNPRQVAQGIVDAIAQDSEIQSLEIAGPGFINITLSPDFLGKRLNTIYADQHLGVPESGKGKKVVIDFSSPNVAKEMHVGHLRSTIIGDSLARLYEFLGYDVLRLNHIGDWGTAFGMLIAYMKEEVPEALTDGSETTLSDLVHWYRESKKRFDSDAEFKKRAQLQVVSLQSGDPESLKAWQTICRISKKAYDAIYELLDVNLIDRGESFYNDQLAGIVEDLEKKGLIEVSDGAKCVFPEGFKNREGERLPLMIQKSDGGYNYATTDMAAIKQRVEVENGDHLIYVTDAGQHTHFDMVFKTAEMAGYLDRDKTRVDHVPFGLVLGEDGKKFRTRSGDVERLIDLLETAVDQALTIVKERQPNMDAKEQQKLAEAIGIGAIKYADLSCHRAHDYTFSYDRMLRFEGNTAAFLLYSYVRIEGIKRKVGIDIDSITESINLQHPSEIALGLHLAQFPEALEQMANDLLPNRLTDYLYTLAEKFNAFYRDCTVEGSEEQNSRLLLCELASRTLKQGLTLLGLKTVERM